MELQVFKYYFFIEKRLRNFLSVFLSEYFAIYNFIRNFAQKLYTSIM